LNKSELIIPSSFFKIYPQNFWRIELEIVKNGIITGSSSINLKINSLPKNGACKINRDNGMSLKHLFYIMCSNWIDTDGSVETYEFFGIFINIFLLWFLKIKTQFILFHEIASHKGNSNPIALSYNSDGYLAVQLPQGQAENNYQLSIFVKIIDDSLGYVVFNIPKNVTVRPSSFTEDELIDQILSNDPRYLLVTRLSTGNMKTITNLLTMVSSYLNFQQNSEEPNSNSTALIEKQEKKKILREYIIEKLNGMPISDLSSIKLFSTALSSSTKSTDELNSNASVNFRIFYVCF